MPFFPSGWGMNWEGGACLAMVTISADPHTALCSATLSFKVSREAGGPLPSAPGCEVSSSGLSL